MFLGNLILAQLEESLDRTCLKVVAWGSSRGSRGRPGEGPEGPRDPRIARGITPSSSSPSPGLPLRVLDDFWVIWEGFGEVG